MERASVTFQALVCCLILLRSDFTPREMGTYKGRKATHWALSWAHTVPHCPLGLLPAHALAFCHICLRLEK